ncbi:MAG TPA: FeoB-associated Cys-rich membrane protein [Bacteroidales bacterium]
MDKGSAIIVLGIVALIVLPFILYSLYKKQKNMKFLKNFMSFAEKEKIKISQKELWNNNYIIGIDNNLKKIIYTNKQNEKEERKIIDLSLVKECRIVNINRTVKAQDGKENISDRLELNFTFYNNSTREESLEFYNSKDFMPTADDQSRIENWLNIVNASLKELRNII